MDPQAGCFSWCPLGKSRQMATRAAQTAQEKSVVPDTQEYIAAGGREIVKVLQSAAELIPIPLLKDALGVAIKVIEICQEAILVEEKVRELQERVEALMIVIVGHVTAGSEEAKIVAAGKAIEKDLKDLLDALNAIVSDLTKIRDQNRLLLVIFSNINKDKVDGCVGRLAVALEKFNVGNDLQQTRALENLQEKLQSIQSLTQFVADQVVLVRNDIKNFSQVVASVKQEANATKLERQDMPSIPPIFFGRDKLVEKMSKLLSLSETALHMCFLGPGGMGKTSIALAIVGSDPVQARFQEEHRVWVPCFEATSASLFLQVLYTSLRVKRQTDSVMSDILYELKSSQDPYLLLLDNFETPWNTSDGQKQVEEALFKLNKLSHVSIVVTMRGSHAPTVDVEWHSEIVPATDKTACQQICHRINPSWDTDPDINGLLEAVGCMPFAVTLMAFRGRESESSAKQLLDEWKQLGTDMLSDGPLESGMNKSIGLSVDSPLVTKDPDALDLLATLSMLPAGTTRKRLKYWAPDLKNTSRAIATLSKAALLQTTSQDDDLMLFVLPVIQSFMLHRNRIPEHVQRVVRTAFCKYVLDHSCRYRDPTFKANAEELAKEDTNVQSILLGAIDQTGSDDQLVQALLAFSWFRRDTRPLIPVVQHTLNLAKANGKSQYIAEALLCLGSSYSEVDNFSEADGILQECSQLLVGDHSNQQLGFECTLARMNVGLYLNSRREERATIIGDLLDRTKDSDPYWHACALDAHGWLYWGRFMFNQALEAFVEAANVLLALGYLRDATSAFYGKAYTLEYLRTPDETLLEAVQEGMEIGKLLGPSPIYGHILMHYGLVHLRMGRLVEALDSFEKCLGTYQYTGMVLGVAQAWDYIGLLYLHTGAYTDAYSAYGAAVQKYVSRGENYTAQMCRVNMDRIKSKEENPQENIGFYRPSCDRDYSTLFYPPGAILNT